MKVQHFLNQVDHDRLHRAIQAAERGTSGRIVIYVSHDRIREPMKKAQQMFRSLGLETAEQKTGFLLLLAPKARKFAVAGGTALHDKLGQPWWDHLAALIGRHFREDRYTEGLLAAVEEVGQKLRADFPASPAPRLEQTDIIEE